MVQKPFHGLNMFVTAEGHVPKVITWGFGRTMPASYTMKMERGIMIGGAVVDEAGLPIAGAKIDFDGPGNDRVLEENIQFGPDAASHTDAEGRWLCNMIPKNFDRISLVVTHPDYAEASASIRLGAAEATNSTIILQAGFTVAGIVEDSTGNAVEGAKVREVRLNGERERSVRTDAAGIFELRNLKAGELMLSVQAEGFAPAVQTLPVTGAVAAVRFRLGPGHLFRGHIIDEDGHPIPSAWVETTRRDIDKVEWSARTDAGGRFAWTSAPQEPILYSFQADGFDRAYALKLQADGSDHEIRLTREKASDHVQITGTALDADSGRPLEAFKVLRNDVEPDWAFPFEFAATGHDGKFSLSFSAKSSHPSYQLLIEKEGYLPAISTNFSRKAGDQTLVFQLRKGAGPSGVVLLPGGAPAANATVLLCTPQGGVTLDGPAHVQSGLNTTTYRAQTDAAGRFSLPAAPSPQGLIVIHDQGYAERTPASLEAVDPITLQPWGRVEGTLILESQPAANERVVANNSVARYDEEGRRFAFKGFYFEARTDSAGRFVFDKLPPGPCKVFRQTRQFSTGFESHETSVVVQAGAVTQVMLGGGGRSLVGKAVFAGATEAIDWRKVAVGLRLKTSREPGARPKRTDFPSREAYIEATDSFDNAYRAQRRFGAFCDRNGAFRIPDVPAGTYLLEIHLRDTKANSVSPNERESSPRQMASLTREVVVPEIPDGQGTEPLDVGFLELVPQVENTAAR
jgi:protocatechuate 3,4-dioxygenase beta subunit